MNLNSTFIVQFIVFFILAGFTMKFIWPPIMKALDERAKKIADGLAAAERSQAQSKEAEKCVQEELAKAREAVQHRIAEAEKRAQLIIEEAKHAAAEESARLLAIAKSDAEHQVSKAREELRHQLAALVVKGAGQILKREINPSVHADLLNQLKVEL